MAEYSREFVYAGVYAYTAAEAAWVALGRGFTAMLLQRHCSGRRKPFTQAYLAVEP